MRSRPRHLLYVSLLAFTAACPGQSDSPLYLTAQDLSIATGQPSLTLMSSGSMHIPVWSLSGGTPGQSVAGLVSGFPAGTRAVKVEIVVTTEAAAAPGLEDVYRVHLSQLAEDAPISARYSLGNPVRTALSAAPFQSRTIVLESFYEVTPDAPLWLRIQREPADPADTFTSPTGLAMVKVTPLRHTLPEPHIVQNVSGYNSWPMIQALGDKLVCVYSRGSAHTIAEDARAVYARTSTDQGKTWTAETLVASSPGFGDVPVGKGLDSTGAMLLWVRRVGAEWHHDLYRTTDGVTFTPVATPKLAVPPVQITDIFAVPKVGLMALWFAGNYAQDNSHSWGTLTSQDDGATWVQTPMESGLSHAQWPTEPAAVYLGEGKILAIARTEQGGPTTAKSQYQMVSTDYGATWTRAQTNIGEVAGSTPSLVLDAKTGLVSNYYYQRGRGGVLRRRVVDPAIVFNHPLKWPVSEAVATGSEIALDSGNVNTTVIGDTHYLAFYSGEAPDTAVLVSVLPAPAK